MLDPVLTMMDGLSLEEVNQVMEKAKERINISPQVKKLLGLIEKLSEEDKYHFLLNLKHVIHGKNSVCVGSSEGVIGIIQHAS